MLEVGDFREEPMRITKFKNCGLFYLIKKKAFKRGGWTKEGL